MEGRRCEGRRCRTNSGDRLAALGTVAQECDATPETSLFTNGPRDGRDQAITIDVANRHFVAVRRLLVPLDVPGPVPKPSVKVGNAPTRRRRGGTLLPPGSSAATSRG